MAWMLTRRGALGAGAAAALASCGGGDPAPSGRPQAGSGAGLLNSIVAFEHASVAAWTAIAPLLRGADRKQARAIRVRELDHAERVSALVRALGGDPPGGRPQDYYERMFPRLESGADALALGRDVEERLVRAYLDALRSLPQADQRRTAAEIAAEEAEDLAVVNVLAGEPPAPQAFVTGTS